MTPLVHLLETHRREDHVLVVQKVLVIRADEVLVLVEHCEGLDELEDDAPLLDPTAERTIVGLLVVGKEDTSGLGVLVAVLVDPLPAELSLTLCPLPVPLFFANVTNLVLLFSRQALVALVTAILQNIVVLVFKFFLADLALDAVFAEIAIPVESVLLDFEFATNLVKHVKTLNAGNMFVT